MSHGGKGGSASQSLNYYGTLAGAICWGPLDWITAVIANGNYVFQGNLDLTDDVTDLTGSILDPTLIAPGGYLKIYRGTETQPADAALAGHPPYRGTALLIAKDIFFGQDSGTAPNLQIIGGRKPRISTAIVAALDNVVDDGQVNPVAAWAEILLDERGGALDIAEFDAPSWLASGHWCAQDQAHKDYSFCSPLVAEQSALREIARQLLDPQNGFCRRTSEGKLACNIYEWGTDPGGLPVLDARYWTKKPTIPLGDWNDVPTELLLNFTDRDYEFQSNSHLVSNARAGQIRQVDDQQRLERKHVTRIAQIHQHGVEYNRRIGTAPSTATIKVRRPIFDALDLNVGDKVKIDTDPEPGGSGLAQLVRIQKIRRDRSDEATVTVLTDNLVPATAYTPTWTPPTPVTEDSPPLANFLGVPLPPNAFGWPPAVGLLATRPDAKIVGFEAYFSTAHASAFADLGQQPGFAVRATLVADITDAAASAQFDETDGLNAPDAGLAANTPGGNATEAGDNVLLALLATLDGNGRIAIGASGDPVMEFVSIIDRSAITGATFDYTILRGRLGTTAQAWAAATTVVWIVPRANIVAWRHSLLSSMLGGVAYFRLVSFTSRAVDDTIPVPELSVNMLAATAPMYGGNIDGGTGPDDGVAPNPVSGVTVTPGLSLLVLRWTNPTNVPLKRIFIYESATGSPPALPQFALDPAQTFLFRTGLAASTTENYWIEVQAQNGRRTRSGPYNGTTRAGIDLSDIVPGMEMVGIVGALPNPVGYTGPKNVLLTTDKKLYRYDPAVPAWTKAVDGADIVANSIIVGALAAGAVTAYAVGSNLVITTTANVGTAVINDAAIISLTADKITVGTLISILLETGYLATDFKMYNKAYGNSSTFPAMAYQKNFYSGPTGGLGAGGTEFWICTFNGWELGSGYNADVFGKPDMIFLCLENGGCTPAAGSFVDLEIICRINGGSTFQVTPFASRALPGNGTLNAVGSTLITGLNGTDVVEFGVRAKSPDAGSTLNVADLTINAPNF